MPDTREADEAGKQESDPYRMACLAAGLGVWDWDLLSNEIALCRLARQIQGFPTEGPVSFERVRAIIHPDDLITTRAALDRALDPGIRSRESHVYRITRPDTEELRWVRAHGVATFAEVEGRSRAVHYSGSIEDITEREEMRRALVESEARLRIALEAAQMAVWELDIESDTVTPSAELNRLYRFPENAAPAADAFRARYAPGEAERLARAGAAARARGETELQTRVPHIFPDGTERVFMLRAALAPADCSGRERAIGVVFDVTEQVRQEQRLETAARELRHRLKNMATLAGVIAGRTWPRDDRHEGFLGRLRAMAAATDLMFGEDPRTITVRDLVEHVLAPFGAASIKIEGPRVPVPAEAVSGLAMALHELATNAMKHGALSVLEGTVSLSWHQEAGHDALDLHWIERDGPEVRPPSHEGFGTQLLRRGALPPPHIVELFYPPDGLVARIRLLGSSHGSDRPAPAPPPAR